MDVCLDRSDHLRLLDNFFAERITFQNDSDATMLSGLAATAEFVTWAEPELSHGARRSQG